MKKVINFKINKGFMKKGVASTNTYLVSHKYYMYGREWLPQNKKILPNIYPKCKNSHLNKSKKIFLKGGEKNGKS